MAPTNTNRQSSSDQLQLLNRAVFSAGTDHQSNPIIVVCPSRLPRSSNLTDLSLLTQHALTLYSSIVSTGPYSLIIFASPSEHSPSLKQLISSYQLISQPIRKNLHSLFVVHPSFWSKITLQVFFKTVVSSKVSRKLKWVKDLSALASLVPIHQICIPPEVYKHDLTIEASIMISPSSQQPPVFNMPLEELMGSNCELGIPQIIKDCTHCIRSSGLKSEGLFRRPPSLLTAQTIREAYDRRQTIKIEDFPDAPFLAASLIKLFLRELPEPIFSPDFYPTFKDCPPIHPQPLITSTIHQTTDLHTFNQQVVQYLKDKILDRLSKPARTLLDSVLRICHDLALHSEHNKMDPRNLATCLAPTMIRSNDLVSDAMMCRLPSVSSDSEQSPDLTAQSPGSTTFSSILKFMISCYPFFEETQDSSISPTGSSFSTPSGSIITVDQSTYSSNETFNSVSSLSESSLDSISSIGLTSSIFDPQNYHQECGIHQIRRVSPSTQRGPLKTGYLPIRCPVSQVGLSHAFTLGKLSCPPSTPLAVDRHKQVSASAPIERCDQDDLESPPPLIRNQSTHRLLTPSYTTSLFLPSITDKLLSTRQSIHSSNDAGLHTTIPVFDRSNTSSSNISTSSLQKSLDSDSYHRHLDELD